jgi:Domain of unknown function (DUF4440)
MSVGKQQRSQDEKWADLTREDLDRTIGDFTVEKQGARAQGLTEEQIAEARAAIKKLVADATAISDKYIKVKGVAKRIGKTIEELVDPVEVAEDRALLNHIVGDEYRLVAPHGEIVGKQRCVDRIMTGAIRPQALGRDGFETTEEVLQVHGNVAVYTGTFSMQGKWLTEDERTGEITEKLREFTYRTMHTYTFRDGRWQLTASQMTDAPKPQVRFATGPGTDRPADWRPEGRPEG